MAEIMPTVRVIHAYGDNENYPADIINRVLSRAVRKENGCLEYRSGECKHKYGLISITIGGKRHSVPAHRALYMATIKDFTLPASIQVRHKCDNPPCVDINHLMPGANQDNVDDRMERGHQRKAETYKPHTRQCKLTDEQVRDIKYGNEKPSYYCREYRITAGYVSKLKHGTAKPLISKP